MKKNTNKAGSRPQFVKTPLLSWIEKLNNVGILVIGDVMLDQFVYGEVSRISPEGPVPVLKSVEMKSTLGGAGNVARNLLALGAKPYLISLVGEDAEGLHIRDILAGPEAIESKLITERGGKTTVKTRFMANRQQLLRVDAEAAHPPEENTCREALQALHHFIDRCAVVILSDYGKGFLSPTLLRGTIELCRERGKLALVDPKGTDYSIYRNASILTPNLKELGEATGLPVSGDEAVVTAALKLIESCQLDAVLATRSQEGMSLIQAGGQVTHLESEAKEVFDVTGAGDTVVAVLAAALAAGAPLPEAAELANVAAGVVVSKVGTAVTHPADLIHAVQHRELSSAEAKILDIRAAMDRVELWRHQGHRIGFTNGLFELLLPKHLQLLSKAREVCDRLVVGLNGDASVYSIKGEHAIIHEAARSAILASLELVDIVVIFQDETPIQLIKALRPDVLIKGSNYKSDAVVGSEIVRAYGGEIVLAEVSEMAATNSTIDLITKGSL